MDWCVRDYEEANHPPEVVLTTRPDRSEIGMKVPLETMQQPDPGGDRLSYQWFYYPEAGTYRGKPIRFADQDQPRTEFIAPAVEKPEIIHLILAATDDGDPPLTRYRRVIVTVRPQ